MRLHELLSYIVAPEDIDRVLDYIPNARLLVEHEGFTSDLQVDYFDPTADVPTAALWLDNAYRENDSA
jgi:hypothetical protein